MLQRIGQADFSGVAGSARRRRGWPDIAQLSRFRRCSMALHAQHIGIVRNRPGILLAWPRVKDMIGMPEIFDIGEHRERSLMAHMTNRAIVAAGVEILLRCAVSAWTIAVAGEAESMAGLHLLIRLFRGGFQWRMAIGALRLRRRSRCTFRRPASRCRTRILVSDMREKIAEIVAAVLPGEIVQRRMISRSLERCVAFPAISIGSLHCLGGKIMATRTGRVAGHLMNVRLVRFERVAFVAFDTHMFRMQMRIGRGRAESSRLQRRQPDEADYQSAAGQQRDENHVE